MKNHEQDNQSLKNIGRWIAVLPAALAGGFVGAIAVSIILLVQSWLVGARHDSGMIWMIPILASAASGVLAVYWGAVVAPKERKIVSMIIATLFIVLNTLGVIESFNSHYPYAWVTTLAGVASVIGAGWVVHKFFIEGDDYKLFD